MNAIIEEIAKARNGQYCHVIEVSNTSEMENIAEAIHEQYTEEHKQEVIIDFLETLEVYYYVENDEDHSEKDEEAVYNFSFTNYINSLV